MKRNKRTKKNVVEHVTKEGSRQHVIHWDTQGRHCSEPDCEINQEPKTPPTPTRNRNNMKTRSGFVSNSSSSSFIVRRQSLMDNVNQTTPEQDVKLAEYGFRKTVAHSPHQLPPFYDEVAWKKEQKSLRHKVYKTGFNYGYEVTCNQDEVITFLVENRISFVASCHYGHESILYDGKTDTVHIGVNYGAIMETYGVQDVFSEINLDKRRPVVKMSGKEWLKTNRY